MRASLLSSYEVTFRWLKRLTTEGIEARFASNAEGAEKRVVGDGF